jgi:hypothetical protein
MSTVSWGDLLTRYELNAAAIALTRVKQIAHALFVKRLANGR